MTEIRFSKCKDMWKVFDWETGETLNFKEIINLLNELAEENQDLKSFNKDLAENLSACANARISKDNRIERLEEENEQLKLQLYCDDEEGVCNICKHHYLVKDDELGLGYYNSRCKKGHYECARVSLKYCEDFEKEVVE